jgi:hypothetical protein
MVRTVSVLALVLGVSACSDPIGPRAIVGGWDRDFTVAGSALAMDLTVTGSAVSGTGSWNGEAGPGGSLAVTGTVRGAAVHLELDFTVSVPPDALGSFRQHFDGRLTSTTSLEGALTQDYDGETPPLFEMVRFHRR